MDARSDLQSGQLFGVFPLLHRDLLTWQAGHGTACGQRPLLRAPSSHLQQ